MDGLLRLAGIIINRDMDHPSFPRLSTSKKKDQHLDDWRKSYSLTLGRLHIRSSPQNKTPMLETHHWAIHHPPAGWRIRTGRSALWTSSSGNWTGFHQPKNEESQESKLALLRIIDLICWVLSESQRSGQLPPEIISSCQHSKTGSQLYVGFSAIFVRYIDHVFHTSPRFSFAFLRSFQKFECFLKSGYPKLSTYRWKFH